MIHSEFIRGWFEIWPPLAQPFFRKLDQRFEFSRISDCVAVCACLGLWICITIRDRAQLSEAASRCSSLKSSFWMLLLWYVPEFLCFLSETWKLLRTLRGTWGCLLVPGRTKDQEWLPLTDSDNLCHLSFTGYTFFFLSLTLKVGKNNIYLGDVYWRLIIEILSEKKKGKTYYKKGKIL